MKVLTLWQPWASLVALGEKKIETRAWQTAYRGPLAIHAAQKITPALQALCEQEPFASALDRVFAVGDKLPLGAIVAVCELDFCVSTNEMAAVFQLWDEGRAYLRYAPQERAFGDYSPHRFAWFLKNVRRLDEPIPCRGYQMLWDLPPTVLARLESQL